MRIAGPSLAAPAEAEQETVRDPADARRDGRESRQGHPADARVAKGRLSGHDPFLHDVGNAGVHFRQRRERSLPATCSAAGGS
jgi:hypothetical protein